MKPFVLPAFLVLLTQLDVAGQCEYAELKRDEFSNKERVQVNVGMFLGPYGLYPWFRRVGDHYFLGMRLAGAGARGTSVAEGSTLLIKFSNDSVITLSSARSAVFEANYVSGVTGYAINPEYHATLDQITMLSRYPVVRVRFNFIQGYEDLDFTGKVKQQQKILRGAACFLQARVP